MSNKIPELERKLQEQTNQNLKLDQALEFKLSSSGIPKKLVLENAQLKAHLKQFSQDTEDLKGKLEITNRDLTLAQDGLQKEKEQSENLRDKYNELEEEKVNLIYKGGDLENQLELQKAEKEMLEQKLFLFEEELKQVYTENGTQVQKNLEELKQENEELSQRKAEFEVQLERFENEKKNLFERLNFAESRMINLERIIVTERQQRIQMERKNEELLSIKKINEDLIAKSNLQEAEILRMSKSMVRGSNPIMSAQSLNRSSIVHFDEQAVERRFSKKSTTRARATTKSFDSEIRENSATGRRVSSRRHSNDGERVRSGEKSHGRLSSRSGKSRRRQRQKSSRSRKRPRSKKSGTSKTKSRARLEGDQSLAIATTGLKDVTSHWSSDGSVLNRGKLFDAENLLKFTERASRAGTMHERRRARQMANNTKRIRDNLEREIEHINHANAKMNQVYNSLAKQVLEKSVEKAKALLRGAKSSSRSKKTKKTKRKGKKGDVTKKGVVKTRRDVFPSRNGKVVEERLANQKMSYKEKIKKLQDENNRLMQLVVSNQLSHNRDVRSIGRALDKFPL